jgi:hypothetical protein
MRSARWLLLHMPVNPFEGYKMPDIQRFQQTIIVHSEVDPKALTAITAR